jgi:hypothetical protein
MNVGCKQRPLPLRRHSRRSVLVIIAVGMVLIASVGARADASQTTVGYQPMVSTGLAGNT